MKNNATGKNGVICRGVENGERQVVIIGVIICVVFGSCCALIEMNRSLSCAAHFNGLNILTQNNAWKL
jgi:hypothetical protein